MSLQATTTYPAIVGRIIAETRKILGINQGQLAQRAGVNQPAWSKIERGQTAITVEQLAIVAPILGDTPSGLLARADATVSHAHIQGVRVEYQRVPPDDSGAMALISAAALGALIGAIVTKS